MLHGKTDFGPPSRHLKTPSREFRRGGEAELWELCNRRFHAALIASCDSPWLIRIQNSLYLQSERYRRLSLSSDAPGRNVRDEHVALYEAAIERNVLKACRMTELHLRNTAKVVRERLLHHKDISDVDANSRMPAA